MRTLPLLFAGCLAVGACGGTSTPTAPSSSVVTTASGSTTAPTSQPVPVTPKAVDISGTWATGRVSASDPGTGNTFSVPIVVANVSQGGVEISANVTYQLTNAFTNGQVLITGSLSSATAGATMTGTMKVVQPSTTGQIVCTGSVPLSGTVTSSSSVTFTAGAKVTWDICRGSFDNFSVTLTR